MGLLNSIFRRSFFYATLTATFILIVSSNPPAQALTASFGRPYQGKLVNGVPFPTQFPGYKVRSEEHTNTTPELIGALLDAIDAVRRQYPDTCDVYLGDFSRPGGGTFGGHRSHQNGRDVDVGLYAKGNRPLDSLVTMNEENLDAAKTWCLMENLLRSQRVMYIFLDRRVQKIIYDYAASHGVDRTYLDGLFGSERGAVIRHVPNHENHMHVRFFTPWSTLAAHVGEDEEKKRMVIDMAQQAYLPKRVNYYVQGNENGLDALARSFGVGQRDLCRWNQLHPNASVPTPGSCLVFYKRGFEVEPVHLAQSLQPGRSTPSASPVQLASLKSVRMFNESNQSEPTAVDAGTSSPREVAHPQAKKEATDEAKADPPSTYKVKRGDTAEIIAKRFGMDKRTLFRLNGIHGTSVRAGRVIKVAVGAMPDADEVESPVKTHVKASTRKTAEVAAPGCDLKSCDPRAIASATHPVYTVGKGDTLEKIAKKKKISIEALRRINGIKPKASLMPGMKLKLAMSTPASKPANHAPVTASKPEKQPVAKAVAGSKTAAKPEKQSTAKVAAASKTVSKPAAASSKSVGKPVATATKNSSKTVPVAVKPVAKAQPAPAKNVSKATGTAKAVPPAKSASKPADTATRKKSSDAKAAPAAVKSSASAKPASPAKLAKTGGTKKRIN